MAPRFLTKNQPVNGATGYPNLKKGMKDGKVTIAEIGPRLKLIRQELGITQKQLAQDLDMNQAILSKLENGGMVYASVFLDVLCYFRDRININYLLQPGDDYSLNDERHRFSNDKVRDIVLDNRRRFALEELRKISGEYSQKCEEIINNTIDFCKSEPE